jgi:hypothetical protein
MQPSCFYKNNIFDFKSNEDSKIYPPIFSSVNPEIFKYGTPHAMPNLINNQTSNCQRNYSGYKTLEQTTNKDYCPSGTLNQLTNNYRTVIPINDVNFYNCNLSI